MSTNWDTCKEPWWANPPEPSRSAMCHGIDTVPGNEFLLGKGDRRKNDGRSNATSEYQVVLKLNLQMTTAGTRAVHDHRLFTTR